MAQYEVDLECAGYSSNEINKTLSEYTDEDKEMVLNTVYPWAEEMLSTEY